MAQIKAAFFDIDGTLLPFHAKALPESTVQALAALRENGVKTFIATGRPPVHLPYLHALDGIPFDGYVTMNGQYCYLADGTPLYSRYIDRAALRTLLPYIEKERISVGFVGKDFCLFNHINDLSRQFALDLQQGEGDVAACIESDAIYQLSAFLPEENEPEFLRSCPGCIAVRWSPDFCDILPAGGGKPNGLAHTLAHLGLTREQSIAFGDGGNDVTMLEYAGIGVAMGNGEDALKQREPDNDFTLVIGADNLQSIRRWRDFPRILSEYGVTVYPRKGYDVDSIKRQLIEECKDFPAPYVLDSEEIVPDGMRSLEETLIRSYNIEVIDAPIVDISSTEIRDGLLAGKDMSEFLM